MRAVFIFLLFPFGARAGDGNGQLPSSDEVVAKMVERDIERQATLTGYTASRHYVLENQRHRKRAEMVVTMTCLNDGSKRFDIVSSAGWGGVRKHVFPRLLSAEAEASQPELRERTRIVPDNYSFTMVGVERINGRQAFVMAIEPRTPSKYLMNGKVWVDTSEYAIVRIEGQPAKNPSFWVKSVHFVHTYAKEGQFWLPNTDISLTDARIFGETELRIEYFDYAPKTRSVTSAAPNQWSRR